MFVKLLHSLRKTFGYEQIALLQLCPLLWFSAAYKMYKMLSQLLAIRLKGCHKQTCGFAEAMLKCFL